MSHKTSVHQIETSPINLTANELNCLYMEDRLALINFSQVLHFIQKQLI